ncbi:Cupin domain-containing protein [Geodermatophilus dictyosporus]|uniref:Cupin domain-containing protein n=2 Tax=Geodermatophilus dictyosporus TaxID=1523247 RepID=A0A1I5PNV5_9ACTN|nr:Cupin domain-containing protein [Geodermatophilus dictyosporus]
MGVRVRHVVTGHDAEGRSVVVSDEATPAIEVGAVPGAQFYPVWGTADGTTTVGTGAPDAEVFPFFPGVGGTRFLLLRFAPESSAPSPTGSADDLSAEVEEKLPGLIGAFEPDAPGMHTTDTIDYGLCVEGEMWLELDDGQEVHLTPGTCVVQRGTRHAWHNRSDEPALMAYVIVGAGRES